MQHLIHRDPAGTEIVGRIVGNCDTVRDAAALLGISDDQFDGDSPRYDYNLMALVDETDLAAKIRAIVGPEPANTTTIDDWLAEGDADHIATSTVEELAAEWQALDE